MGTIPNNPDPNDDVNGPNDDHDPLTGDVPDPDVSALSNALDAAFIRVEVIDYEINGVQISESDLPFRAGFSDEADALAYAAAHRQTPAHDEDFWAVQIVGYYENGFDKNGVSPGTGDNDVNSNRAVMGFSKWQPNGDIAAFVAMEVIADVADQHDLSAGQKTSLLKLVALHEIGHLLGARHSDADTAGDWDQHTAMSTPGSDADEAEVHAIQLEFSEENIRRIRKVMPSDGPGGHLGN
ncbi:MAG: hypothetical protein ACI8P0_000446 [Planctomycetaceae bacterium]|jgi:hypothetical protein